MDIYERLDSKYVNVLEGKVSFPCGLSLHGTAATDALNLTKLMLGGERMIIGIFQRYKKTKKATLDLLQF